MTWRVLEGDATERLRELAAGSVQTCITSPPYWGLRDYGTAAWDGGDPECDHKRKTAAVSQRSSTLGPNKDGLSPDNAAHAVSGAHYDETCGKCGATRIDSQLGLEPTPEQYVANLIAVFREVRRVLRDDGTVWLNLGDSYATGAGKVGDHPGGGAQGEKWQGATTQPNRMPIPGLKPKDLVGIPWMVAFALRADGWWLRSDIVWAKPNPMPESVTDRPTRSHEYIFLLTKSARYFYDADAIREAHEMTPQRRNVSPIGRRGDDFAGQRGHKGMRDMLSDEPTTFGNPAGRNKRSVWTVATQPFPGAHFATFPPKLIEPCVLAGSPPKCCGECGAPWERVVERQDGDHEAHERPKQTRGMADDTSTLSFSGNGSKEWAERGPMTQTLGWRSTCAHDDDTAHSLILDPFCGAGTTGVVALRHDRDFIGVELNADYAEMARNRIRDDAPLLNGEEAYSVPTPLADKQSATGQQQLGGDRMSGLQ